MRRARAQDGFTVMEVLLAAAIVVTITTLLWGAFAQTFRIKRNTEEVQDRYHTVQLALERMARDIGLAYLSLNEMPSAIDKHTYFVSTSGMEPRLDFSAMAHQHLYRDAREGDTGIVSYYLGRDPEDRRRMQLWRRESRRLVTMPDLPRTAGEAFIICPDVTGLHFSFFDQRTQEWRDDWNTTSADGQPNRLPWRVRIELTFQDGGRPVTFSTDARIHLDEPIDGRPDRAQ